MYNKHSDRINRQLDQAFGQPADDNQPPKTRKVDENDDRIWVNINGKWELR